jgi:hypothetical protein
MTTRFALQLCAWIVGIPLQLMVIAAMVRGSYRQYPLLFVYVIAGFLTAVAEIPANLAREAGGESNFAFMYWIDDVFLQVLLYAIVLHLIFKATAQRQPRALVRTILTAGAVILTGVSLLLHYNPPFKGEWVNVWMRDLSFFSMALDLALWTVLISSRKKDPQLMMISGGLGIQFAGTAIGDAVQDLATRSYQAHTMTVGMAEKVSLSGGIFSVVAGFACLYILRQALRSFNQAPAPAAAMAASKARGADL